MKNILKTLIVVLLIAFISGCSKDYFKVNVPSGAVSESQLSMNDLLGPVLYHTVIAQYYAERTFGNYSQNFTGQGGTSAGVTSISGTWSNTYLYAMPNLLVIREKAKALNAKHFDAIAQILIAMNMGLAADSWDNVPYTEAAKLANNLNPKFDTQESVYNAIFNLLDSAIAELEGADPTGILPTPTSDLIYRGDMTKWLKTAYTLKARYLLHLIKKKGAVASATAALASIAKGYTSNNDDFQMFYTDKIINPWYSREVLAKHTGNDHDVICDQLVSYMDGTSFPFTGGTVTMDPRLPVYAETDDGSAVYKGFESGGFGFTADGVTQANTVFRENGYYTNSTSPIVVISYAEALFIKAEAEFLINGGTTTSTGTSAAGYQAYLDGIKANMSKLGVSSAGYISDPSVDMGAAALKLQNIMKEKFIANFLNPETFVDLRRYDFSPDVFKDFAFPADNAQSVFPGQWLVRAQYPSTEENRNSANVNANKKSPVDPVWWEQ